jgi:hypothetical protein
MSGCRSLARTGGVPKGTLKTETLKQRAFSFNKPWRSTSRPFSSSWKLRKIHELDALLDEAAKYEQELEKFRDLCERVSGYYLAERYPPLSALELSSADIRKDLKEAREFVKLMFPAERFPLQRK